MRIKCYDERRQYLTPQAWELKVENEIGIKYEGEITFYLELIMAVWARGRKPRHYKIHIISVNNPVFRPSIHENPFFVGEIK